MARTLKEIQDSIKTEIRVFPSLDNFIFPEDGGSQVSVFNLIISTVSIGIQVSEVIFDAFKIDIEGKATSAISPNSVWLQGQILAFQDGDIIQISDVFVPFYPVPDVNKQIITRVAIVDTTPITIKVAKGIAPNLAPLSTEELLRLNDYYFGTATSEGIGIAGVDATFITKLPDEVFIDADIFYTAQLDPNTVKTNVILAIDNFFATFQSINFNGTIFMISLVDAIQVVNGVTRVVLNTVRARDTDTPFPGGTVIDPQGFYATISGYAISETESGSTPNETLIMIPETF